MHWLPRGMARLWCSANTHSTKSWEHGGGGVNLPQSGLKLPGERLNYHSQGLNNQRRKVLNYLEEGVKLPGGRC